MEEFPHKKIWVVYHQSDTRGEVDAPQVFTWHFKASDYAEDLANRLNYVHKCDDTWGDECDSRIVVVKYQLPNPSVAREAKDLIHALSSFIRIQE